MRRKSIVSFTENEDTERVEKDLYLGSYVFGYILFCLLNRKKQINIHYLF